MNYRLAASGVALVSACAVLTGSVQDEAARGTLNSQLREVRALAGVLQRNFDYDRFWVTFPLTGGRGVPLFAPGDESAELVVRIHDKEGRVEWPIPTAARVDPRPN